MKRMAYGVMAMLLGGAPAGAQKGMDVVGRRQVAPMVDASQIPWFVLNGPPVNPVNARPATASGGKVSVEALKVPEGAAKEMQKFFKDFDDGKLADSLKHVSKAIQLYPRWAAAHYNLGQTYARMGDYDKAIVEFQSATELDGTMTPPWVGLSKVYFLQKKFGDGEEAARRALQIDPVNSDARYFLARNLVAEGQTTNETVELLQKSEEQFIAARLVLANVYLKRGAANPAVEELRAYTAQPNAPDREKVQCMVRKLTEPAGTVNCAMQ